MVVFFFLFQAEDGIRDYKVTGVQTCALPISCQSPRGPHAILANGSRSGGITMKRIRAFLESIVFAGMKPGAQTAPKRQLAWLGPLRGPVERLLSGGPAPTDPLYLTNRSLGRKLLSWSLVGIPCLVLLAGIGITLSNLLDPPLAKPAKELTDR